MNKKVQKNIDSEQSDHIDNDIGLNSHLPLNSVAFAEVYDDFTKEIGVSSDFFIDSVMLDKPLLTTILETEFGRIGIILLPIKNGEIYISSNLIDSINDGINLAQEYGAKSASLTGLIPSATNYGKDIDYSKNDGFLLTTGHASTVSAIALNVTNALNNTKRNIDSETIAYIGLGSIGMATINLMLSVLPHPKKILLCDLFSRSEEIEKIKNLIINKFNFKGEISATINPNNCAAIHKSIYDEATLMIGATNVPDIISTDMLRPGTIIIDDSAPHIFEVDSCLERFKKQKDILVLQAGKLTLSKLFNCIYTDFKRLSRSKTHIGNKRCIRMQREIMGCTFGSLLPLISEKTPSTLGTIEAQTAVSYYDFFCKQKILASSLQCGNHLYQPTEIEEFRINSIIS